MNANCPQTHSWQNDGPGDDRKAPEKFPKCRPAGRLSTVLRICAALCVDSPREKSTGVDNFPCRLPAHENKFLKFGVMHKNQKSFLPEGRTAFG